MTPRSTDHILSDDFAIYLRCNGFSYEGEDAAVGIHTWTFGPVRVAREGDAIHRIYVFEGISPLDNGVVMWTAEFNSAPEAIVARAIESAVDVAMSALLPRQ